MHSSNTICEGMMTTLRKLFHWIRLLTHFASNCVTWLQAKLCKLSCYIRVDIINLSIDILRQYLRFHNPCNFTIAASMDLSANFPAKIRCSYTDYCSSPNDLLFQAGIESHKHESSFILTISLLKATLPVCQPIMSWDNGITSA